MCGSWCIWDVTSFYAVPRVTLNLNVINTPPPFLRWYQVPSLAGQSLSFLQKLVCLQWKLVLCYRKCLAFVVVYGHKASSVVWSFCPMNASAGDMPFLSDMRGEMVAVSPLLLFSPLCFEQSMFKCVKTFCLTIGLWVVGWSTNVLCNLTCRNDRTTQMRILLHCLRQAMLTE